MPDIFLSYSSKDRPWAARLAVELRRLGFDVFFDVDSLRAGEGWEGQIRGAVDASQHFVLLDSNSAKDSDWVRFEQRRYEAILYPTGGETAVPDRVFMPVALKRQDASYGQIQAILDLDAAYPDLDKVDQATWSRVGQRISDSIRNAGDPRAPITRAIVTTTADRIDGIDFTYRDEGGRIIDVLDSIQIGSKDELKRHYGPLRSDWKPFGAAQPDVQKLLDDVRVDLKDGGAQPFRWVSVDDDLWSFDERRQKPAANLLSTTPAVVVLDPLSLYDRDVSDVFNNYLHPVFENSNAVLMVLTPFPMPQINQRLRTVIGQRARRIIDHFYQELPLTSRPPYANCAVFTDDDRGVKRLLRGMLRSRTDVGRNEAASVVFGVGGGRR
jgi:hypothetical protein